MIFDPVAGFNESDVGSVVMYDGNANTLGARPTFVNHADGDPLDDNETTSNNLFFSLLILGYFFNAR